MFINIRLPRLRSTDGPPSLTKGLITWRISARAEILAQLARLWFSARANVLKSLKKSHVIETEFQPELKSELGHAFFGPMLILLRLFVRLIFQPGLKFVM